MTLGKITIDNIVKYIPQSEQKKDSKLNTVKNNSITRKQDKYISQKDKNLLKNVAA